MLQRLINFDAAEPGKSFCWHTRTSEKAPGKQDPSFTRGTSQRTESGIFKGCSYPTAAPFRMENGKYPGWCVCVCECKVTPRAKGRGAYDVTGALGSVVTFAPPLSLSLARRIISDFCCPPPSSFAQRRVRDIACQPSSSSSCCSTYGGQQQQQQRAFIISR